MSANENAVRAGCPNGGECDGGGWVPRAEYFEGDPDGGAEAWWEPCEACNVSAVRVREGPDSEPFWVLPGYPAWAAERDAARAREKAATEPDGPPGDHVWSPSEEEWQLVCRADRPRTPAAREAGEAWAHPDAVDEGLEWVERAGTARELRWHVYRCPHCGAVWEGLGPSRKREGEG